MIDTTSLYISNLTEAFKQINQYLAVGLLTSLSAVVVGGSTEKEAFSVQGLPPMARDTATLVLLAISFIAGLMGSYAAVSAAGIVSKLHESPELLKAACTFSSVATAPIGIPILAAALPVIFVAPVFWRQWKALHADRDARKGLLIMFGLFIAAYGILGKAIASMPCRAS